MRHKTYTLPRPEYLIVCKIWQVCSKINEKRTRKKPATSVQSERCPAVRGLLTHK
jgi:hypothetical protein